MFAKWLVGCRPPFRVGGYRTIRSHPLHGTSDSAILNLMVQYNMSGLDVSFAVLADGTRRGVLEQLGRSESSITDLAEYFDMTLTGMKKHVTLLEEAGLVVTEKVGRVRWCRIGTRRLDEVTGWIDGYHRMWDERFNELDKVLEEAKREESKKKENTNGHK